MNNEQAWKDRGEWTGQSKCGRSTFSCDTTMPSKDRRDQYDIEQRIKVSTMLKTKMIVTTPKQIIKTQWVIAYHPKPKSQYTVTMWLHVRSNELSYHKTYAQNNLTMWSI